MELKDQEQIIGYQNLITLQFLFSFQCDCLCVYFALRVKTLYSYLVLVNFEVMFDSEY